MVYILIEIGYRGEMMIKKIRVHKEINLLPIQMEKESLVNVFYGLIEKYNKNFDICCIRFIAP